jgi:hypothetical protein
VSATPGRGPLEAGVRSRACSVHAELGAAGGGSKFWADRPGSSLGSGGAGKRRWSGKTTHCTDWKVGDRAVS